MAKNNVKLKLSALPHQKLDNSEKLKYGCNQKQRRKLPEHVKNMLVQKLTENTSDSGCRSHIAHCKTRDNYKHNFSDLDGKQLGLETKQHARNVNEMVVATSISSCP